MIRTTLLQHIGTITVKYLKSALPFPSMVLFPDERGVLKIWAQSDPGVNLTTNEHAIASWVLVHSQPAGNGTKTLPSSRLSFLPMKVKEKTLGVVGLSADYSALLPDERYAAGAIANLAAVAVEKL
jgi:K+-sensing histidine kinase KdpD